jgi:hypothetical protein
LIHVFEESTPSLPAKGATSPLLFLTAPGAPIVRLIGLVGRRPVQPASHVSSGREERKRFPLNRDGLTGAWIARGPRRSAPDWRDVENIVNAILDAIVAAIARGDRVELLIYGRFGQLAPIIFATAFEIAQNDQLVATGGIPFPALGYA